MYSREVLLRETGPLLQSLSSVTAGGSLAGPKSPRRPPNRLRGSSGGPLGTNLLPLDQTSSESAAPEGPPSWARNPEPRLLGGSNSEGGLEGEARAGGARLERQSLILSETAGGGGSRDEGPSNRRREPSRPANSGNGPSRRQLLANLSSSNPPPPKPERSFAIVVNLISYPSVITGISHSRGSATLIRTVLPARGCKGTFKSRDIGY